MLMKELLQFDKAGFDQFMRHAGMLQNTGNIVAITFQSWNYV